MNELRNGFLDKKGVGLCILDVKVKVDLKEFVWLEEFVSEKIDVDGYVEFGFDLDEL